MPKGKKSTLTPEQKEELERKKEERFKKVATARVNRVLFAMEQLSSLGNKTYSSTDDDKDKIINALHDKIEEVEKALHSEGKQTQFEF